MIVNFRNYHECFDIKMLVNKWDKLDGIRRANGGAYPKELFALKWEVKSISGRDMVIYKDMHRIID